MRLFVANCSKQVQEFAFWPPEASSKRPNVVKIGIGEQVQVYKEAPKNELENIIDQHTPYGMVRTDEIDRAKEFVGLAYQFDKPINVEKIMSASEMNDAVLVKGSVERRKEAATALDNSLSEVARESGNKLASLSTEVEEVERPGAGDTMSETITVQKEGSRGRRRSQ